MNYLLNANNEKPKSFATTTQSPTFLYSFFAAWRPLLLMSFSIGLIMLSPYPYVSAASAIIWMLFFVYKVWYLCSSSYMISGEQIIYTRGIFNISTDFIELYRVKDYRVRRPILMRLISVMRLELVTSDKMNTEFIIAGIPNSDLAMSIRNLVEVERDRKNVYEID